MINRENFLIKEFPEYHPLSMDYLDFWNNELSKIIEGTWSGGYWIPGRLYFYANYATIILSKKGSNARFLGNPRVRDIEWEILRYWEECRGFSGFTGDKVYSCSRYLDNPELTDQDLYDLCLNEYGIILQDRYDNLFTPDNKRKVYVKARDYLKKQFPRDMGRPLYENPSKNMLMIGPRAYGKSYLVANIVAYEFLFDGATIKDDYVGNLSAKKPSRTNSIICAGDAKYSNATSGKSWMTIENLPGQQQIGDRSYPAPFFKKTAGSLQPGKELVAKYKKKIGSSWETAGTQSTIKNRTFRDNPFAAQGERASVMVWDEIGFFNNLRMAFGATEDNQKVSVKFGSSLFTGTGGDFDKEGTLDARYMYYNPKAFDMLTWEDPYEKAGITGLFLSSEYTDEQFKNSQGFSTPELLKRGRDHYLKERKLRSDGGDSIALDNFIVYHPLFPSEVFLTRHGNIFPVAEIGARMNKIRETDAQKVMSKKVSLYYNVDEPTGVGYKIDVEDKLTAIDEFPWNEPNKEGAVVVYEFPQVDPETGQVPPNLYIIGHDPYASDNPDGASLGTIYVVKTKQYGSQYGHDEIVAQYVGRPYQGRAIVNENLHKLSLFYGNAKVYYENAVGNVKEFFEKHKSLQLLAKTPQTVLTKKASFDGGQAVTYGYPMSSRAIKAEALTYLRDWLLEIQYYDENQIPVRNLDRIWDMALLDELAQFNYDGNFDRVMGLAGAIVGIEETFNQYREHLKDTTPINSKRFLDFLSSNKSIFQGNGLPSSTKYTYDKETNLRIL